MPVIKLAGKGKATPAKAKPAAKKSTTSTAKRTTRTASKTATSKPAAAKKTTTRKPTAAAKPAGRPKSTATTTEQKRHVAKLEKLGAQRAKHEQALQDTIEEIYDAVQEALSDNVPMTLVSEKVGVSRQWLYKMGEFRGRNGASKPAAKKPAARSTAAKKPAARKPAAKAAAKPANRVRIKR